MDVELCLLTYLEPLEEGWYYYFSIGLVESPVKPSSAGRVCWEFLVTNLISLLDISVFSLSLFSWKNLRRLGVFSGVCISSGLCTLLTYSCSWCCLRIFFCIPVISPPACLLFHFFSCLFVSFFVLTELGYWLIPFSCLFQRQILISLMFSIVVFVVYSFLPSIHPSILPYIYSPAFPTSYIFVPMMCLVLLQTFS